MADGEQGSTVESRRALARKLDAVGWGTRELLDIQLRASIIRSLLPILCIVA